MKMYEDKIQPEHAWWHKLVLLAIAVLIALTLFGCSSLGLTQPQGAQQSIAYGYSGVTAALNTLAQLTTAGAVSSTDAIKANSAILNAKSLLDQANTAAASSAPVAISLITTATADLAQVSLYLTCKQQKATSCQLSL